MDESRHHICGINELSSAPLATAGRVISLLEPGAALPPELTDLRADLLLLRFHDVIEPLGAYVAPARQDIARLLEFDRSRGPQESLVVHCRAGISRSTAAFAIAEAQRRPSDETAIFAELRRLRPPAWPNSLMVTYADELLGSGGRLVAALREHYKIQLRAHPEIGRMMISLGREREIPFDRFVPDPAPAEPKL